MRVHLGVKVISIRFVLCYTWAVDFEFDRQPITKELERRRA